MITRKSSMSLLGSVILGFAFFHVGIAQDVAMAAGRAASGGAGVPPGYSATLKVSHTFPPKEGDTQKHGHALTFKRLVEKRTKGQAKVEIYPLGQLYSSDKDALMAVVKGDIFGSEVDMMALPAWEKGTQIFLMPGLFEDREHLQRFMARDKGGKELMRRLEKKGFGFTGALVGGESYVWTTFPVEGVSDLKGRKIRVRPDKIDAEITRSLEAVAVPLGAAEVYTGLQTGMIEGILTHEFTIALRKLYENIHYCIQEPALLFMLGPVYSMVQFNKMPPAIQNIVRDAWTESLKINSDLTEEFLVKLHKMCVEGGISYIKLQPNEVQKFDKGMQSVTNRYVPEIGKNLHDEAVKTR